MWKADDVGERMLVIDSTLDRWGCGCSCGQDSMGSKGKAEGVVRIPRDNPHLLLPGTSLLVYILL